MSRRKTAGSPAKPAAPAYPRVAETSMGAAIVSSAHLVSERSTELSEFEFGLIIAGNAFARWAVRCMAAAGLPDLTLTDVLVLHHVNHRERSKKLADICFTLNYEDTHVVNYSLKKLVALGAVESEKIGKEVFYRTSPEGQRIAQRYREVREACLISAISADENEEIGQLAALLRALSGLYDQAARAATSL
jgi:predicted MarR family transcription regulator